MKPLLNRIGRVVGHGHLEMKVIAIGPADIAFQAGRRARGNYVADLVLERGHAARFEVGVLRPLTVSVLEPYIVIAVVGSGRRRSDSPGQPALPAYHVDRSSTVE
jgi:hypothetical protein